MRLIIFEDQTFENFYPIALSRAVFELKCGWNTLAEKIQRQFPSVPVGYFCRDWIEPVAKKRLNHPVNDANLLKGDDLMIVNGRLICNDYNLPVKPGSTQIATLGDDIVYLRVAEKDIPPNCSDIEDLISKVKPNARAVEEKDAPLAGYVWDVMLKNPEGLIVDFKAAGKHGIEGTVEEPNAIRGSKDNVYIAKGVQVHPFVCIDASEGPVYIDSDVEIHPYTRIEGPAYIGPKSILLGTKLREGCTIGPVCRVGGEVEESIIHGYSNKYHDGFLGHAYLGEWINLGALTTNSDLKNDYSSVEVMLNGKKVNTGSTKVGAIIGDHTKTSIGTLFNTGAICGAMCLLMATGEPLPKSIPSFSWLINKVITKGFGKKALYKTAETAMSRRKQQWTEEEKTLWEKVFEITAEERSDAVKRGRRKMLG